MPATNVSLFFELAEIEGAVDAARLLVLGLQDRKSVV